jgi:hypothetical protein
MAPTHQELRAQVLVRLEAADSCTTDRERIYGQIQGLIFALTGEVKLLGDETPTSAILSFAGIPFTHVQEGNLEITDEWMVEHGFEKGADGSFRHPQSSAWQ